MKNFSMLLQTVTVLLYFSERVGGQLQESPGTSNVADMLQACEEDLESSKLEVQSLLLRSERNKVSLEGKKRKFEEKLESASVAMEAAKKERDAVQKEHRVTQTILEFSKKDLKQCQDDLQDRKAQIKEVIEEMAAAQDPISTENIYADSIVKLSFAGLAYAFSDVIDLAQDNNITLTIPEEFPAKNLTILKAGNLTDYNNGNGISFYEIYTLVEENFDVYKKAFDEGQIKKMGGVVFKDVKKAIASGEYAVNHLKAIYLSFHRSVQQDVACVYSIIKDTHDKKIIVTFRGSVNMLGLLTGGNRDWRVNFLPGTAKMETPEKIKDKLDGNLQDHVLVRKGFYEYLFNNTKKETGKLERYVKIRRDIQILLKDETDYELYVTGHSLGGALATLFAFNLAGGGASEDMLGAQRVAIPKPVKCITFGAPPSGTLEFRTAFEHLEREGLLQSIRITNYDDPVPTLPTKANFVSGPRMGHVGINIRLTSSGYSIEHSSQANWRTAEKNMLIFKPLWKFPASSFFLTPHPHALRLHRERFEKHMDTFMAMKLDDMYKNNSYVSQDFLDGNIR